MMENIASHMRSIHDVGCLSENCIINEWLDDNVLTSLVFKARSGETFTGTNEDGESIAQIYWNVDILNDDNYGWEDTYWVCSSCDGIIGRMTGVDDYIIPAIETELVVP